MSQKSRIEQRALEMASINEWGYSDSELLQFATEAVEQDDYFGGRLTHSEISAIDLFIFTARGMFSTKKLHLSLGIKPSAELEAMNPAEFKVAKEYIETQLFRLDRSEIQRHRVCCHTSRFVLQWIPHAKMFIYVR